MLRQLKHRWVETGYKRGITQWCNLCGCIEQINYSGWWWPVRSITYVTPWNHHNGDKNTTAFSTLPACVSIDIPEDFQI
jgi:hypothetical protein